MQLIRGASSVLGLLLSALFVFGTVCPLLTTDVFWVRIFDFPRIQLIAIAVVAAALLLAGRWPKTRWKRGIFLLLLAGVVLQGTRVFPYTQLASVEVPLASDGQAGDRIRVLTCNVFQHNKSRQLVLDQIAKEAPHLVLLLEVNQAWQEALTVLHDEYPHRIIEALENTWGIAFYSKLPLDVEDVHYYTNHRRPAVRAVATAPSGRKVFFMGLHPAPPGYERPNGERVSSAPRDHTLVTAAKEARDYSGPVLIAGDFNDAAWSRMTRQFQEISGLLDPRIGRGLFNTYDANSTFLRYPIDHIFLSPHFHLIELRRLPAVGSDHFPMLVEVVLRP